MTKLEIAKSYGEKFPNLGDRTLARVLFDELPHLFPTLETARSAVRTLRGHRGKFLRQHTKDKSEFQPVNYNRTPYKAPESHQEIREPYVIKNPFKTLVVSDVHFPYHDEKALEAAINHGISQNCKTLLINGDMLDMYQISRFLKRIDKPNVSEEFEMGREFFREMKKIFDRVILKIGNHEARWEMFLMQNPHVFGMTEFQIDVILRLGEIGVEYVKSKQIIHLGKLNVLHGHETSAKSGGVNPARSMFLAGFENLMVGHFHKTSTHVETTLEQRLITTYSLGCLCELSPDYMAYANRWNHGFAVVDVAENGEYSVDNKRIFNGKVY